MFNSDITDTGWDHSQYYVQVLKTVGHSADYNNENTILKIKTFWNTYQS